MTVQGSIAERAAGLLSLFGQLRAELKANRRAAAGLLAVGCLLAGYGLVTLDDAVGALRTRYIETGHRLDRLAAIGQEKDWPARAALSEQMRASLEGRLWKGDSEGIVQADIQDWITNHAREAGLEKVQASIEITKPQKLPVDYRMAVATIKALDTESSLVSFLDRIQRNPQLLIVDRLQVRTRPTPAMEMKLVAYALINNSQLPQK